MVVFIVDHSVVVFNNIWDHFWAIYKKIKAKGWENGRFIAIVIVAIAVFGHVAILYGARRIEECLKRRLRSLLECE